MNTGNSEQANIHLVTSAFHSFNEKNWDAVTSMMTDDFAINIAGMPYQRQGVPAWRENIDLVHAGFPDIQAKVEDVFGSGDKVVVRLTMSGTHSGEFMGFGPTGRRVEYVSIEIYRISGGLLAEEWICSDLATLMAQVSGEPVG